MKSTAQSRLTMTWRNLKPLPSSHCPLADRRHDGSTRNIDAGRFVQFCTDAVASRGQFSDVASQTVLQDIAKIFLWRQKRENERATNEKEKKTRGRNNKSFQKKSFQ
jgi:hypothetical protein